MLIHNLLLIYRNFRHHKSSFLINLVCLSTGLASALLIYLWINDEISIDKFHEKDAQLFQVMKNKFEAGVIQTNEFTPGLLANALAEEMPEVVNAVPVFPPSGFYAQGIITTEKKNVRAKSKFVGKDFFNIFSYRLLHGDRDKVLNDKYSIAISDELSNKLFNTTHDVIGKTVKWNQERFDHNELFIVAAIFEKVPANASIQFDLLLPFELLREIKTSFSAWGSSGPSTYVELKKGTDLEAFNDKIASFLKSKDKKLNSTLFVRKYSDQHLFNQYENGVATGGRISYLRLFSIIGISILLIACINFVNLSTAKASRRIKEVGIKKVVGANRKTLFAQYLGESMLMSLLSLFVAVLIVEFLLPQFNEITGKHLTLYWDAKLIFSFLSIAIFTGVAAGSYPALYISSFNPLNMLNGKLNTAFGELLARKGLVVFQFAISVILIVSVLVVYQQVEYVQSKKLGYERDHIIHFEKDGKLNTNLTTFLSELRNIPGIVNVSNMGYDVSRPNGFTWGIDWEGKNPDDIIEFANLEVGYNLIETIGYRIKEGRAFSKDFGAKSSKIIFNEAAIESMGIEDPIGKTIRLWGGEYQIVGIVKNFHFESLYEKVKPCFLRINPNAGNIVVKLAAGTEKETIEQIEKLDSQYNLGLAFEYKFMDEDYQHQYIAEKRISILSRYFAGLAIIISSLGLFGLATFTAERKIKEIGIRKVLGAKIPEILILLNKEFIKWVVLAAIIASPIAYYIMSNWLQDFAYRIDINLWVFVLSGGIALLVALFTVSVQVIKAATTNPIKSLRSE